MPNVRADYSTLRGHLASTDEPEVPMSFHEVALLVRGLPTSALKYQAWWHNTLTSPQGRAWLDSGRRAIVSIRNQTVRFVLHDGASEPVVNRTARSQVLMDGVRALALFTERAGYASINAAVAEHTIFLPPETVAQTGGQALLPVIRNMLRRGEMSATSSGRRVLLDDNTSPKLAFLWAAGKTTGPDLQYNHVWDGSGDPDLYTALWNLCATPAFLAKTTDGRNHPEVRAMLRYRAFDLYGWSPIGVETPTEPPGYSSLVWAPMPAPVEDLEATLRARLMAAPKSRPAIAARELGWLFSEWISDTALGPASEIPSAPLGALRAISTLDHVRTLVSAWKDRGRPAQLAFPWPRQRWLALLPQYSDELNRLPDTLDRPTVRAACSEASEGPRQAVAAFLAVMAWGFGVGVGYGPWRTRRILSATPDAAERLRRVAEVVRLEGAAAGYDTLASQLTGLKYLGPAFGTKYLYFVQPPGASPTALILDRLVASVLDELGHPTDPIFWSSATYKGYLTTVHQWAGELGCQPDEVEFVLFQNAATKARSQWAKG